MVALAGLVRREGHQKAGLKVGLDMEAGPHACQDRVQDRLGLGRVLALEMGRGEPVLGQGRVGVAMSCAEELGGFGRQGDRLPDLACADQRLGQAPQQFGPCARRGRGLEKVAVGGDGLLPATAGQEQVGFQPSPPGRLVVDELTGWDAQACGEVIEGRHRRPAQAVLERTDVGLRVARLGQLCLRQTGCQPGFLQTLANLAGEGRIVDSGTGAADSCHREIIRYSSGCP